MQCFPVIVFLLIFISHAAKSTSMGKVEYLPGFQDLFLLISKLGVGNNEEVQLFYYFIESESDPGQDPLMLWITGGPGCSSISGILYEIGPIQFKVVPYNRSLPSLIPKPHSWTKIANIIFLDFPVGIGFSYAKTTHASHTPYIQSSDQAYEFMIKWLGNHPQFIPNKFYVGGDSFSGLPVPVIMQLISDGNEAGSEPHINLKVDVKDLAHYWADDASVRKALHIREGSIGEWIRCADINFTWTVTDVRPYHLTLSNKGYHSLVYSGDHDMIVPHHLTQAWVKELNYSITDQWRSWKLHGQIAGYTESYSNKMTYATVKGAGHTAPTKKPEECLAMFKRWISDQPL